MSQLLGSTVQVQMDSIHRLNTRSCAYLRPRTRLSPLTSLRLFGDK